ncbi:MAG: PAS domain-containing protein [Candidatus Hadarchaeota archaeon]
MDLLVVHDESEVWARARRFLEKNGKEFEIEIARSVNEALNWLSDGDFDAVISGHLDPGIDGLTLLKKLRKDLDLDVPFVIFTANRGERDCIEALNLGANRYLKREGDLETRYEALAEAALEEIEEYRELRGMREAEKSAMEKEGILEGIFENFPASIYVKNSRGEITRASKLYRETRREEGHERVIGKTDFDFFEPELAEGAWEDDKRVIETEDPIVDRQERSVDERGGIRYYETSKAPVYDENGDVSGLVGMTKDITDRVKPKMRLEALLKHLPLPVYFKDREGKHVEVSDYLVDGLDPKQAESKEDVIGSTDFDLYDEKLAGETREDEVRIMETREPVENKLEHFDAEEPREAYSLVTKAPLIDMDGNVRGIMGVSRDVTDRIKAERRKEFLHSLLRHDIRNKLQLLRGYNDILDSYDLSDEVREYVKKSKDTLRDSLDLIEKIRTLREIEESGGEGNEIELSEVLSSAADQNRNFASERGVEINCRAPDCRVIGGPLLERLFFNLIENSIEHSSCSEVRIGGRKDGSECVIVVEDDGLGVSDEKKEKIFKKSYTESESTGSGLGLYLVKEIAENYDGSVELLDSDLGGARFEVRLRIAEN